MTVTFGRMTPNPVVWVSPILTALIFVLLNLVIDSRIGVPVMVAVSAISFWSATNQDRGLAVTAETVTLRKWRTFDTFRAPEVTTIRMEKVPGYLARRLQVVIESGPYNAMTFPTRFRNDEAGRAHLGEQVEAAQRLLRLPHDASS